MPTGRASATLTNAPPRDSPTVASALSSSRPPSIPARCDRTSQKTIEATGKPTATANTARQAPRAGHRQRPSRIGGSRPGRPTAQLDQLGAPPGPDLGQHDDRTVIITSRLARIAAGVRSKLAR